MRKIDLNNFRVARSETARDINRRIVLNLIRKNQPVSRAGLARTSGLQRSTVSAITEQLIEERWVTEIEKQLRNAEKVAKHQVDADSVESVKAEVAKSGS